MVLRIALEVYTVSGPLETSKTEIHFSIKPYYRQSF